MLNDFKPALLFLSKFLAIYFAGNILYGIYVESCGNTPDVFTRNAAFQTTLLLKAFDGDVYAEINQRAPTVLIERPGMVVLNVYEGCNGLNVMIVFVAFLVAFGGPLKKMVWFTIIGLIIIHFANLGRLSLLYYVAQHFENYFYFVHKYFFTAILYLVVFMLWIIWAVRFNAKPASNGKN